jgi:hypothetical protein
MSAAENVAVAIAEAVPAAALWPAEFGITQALRSLGVANEWTLHDATYPSSGLTLNVGFSLCIWLVVTDCR